MPLFFLAAALALALDQLSKLWIRAHLPFGARIEVLPAWIHLQHVQNRGAAWGVLSGQKLFLVIFTAIVIGIVLKSAREVVGQGKVAALGFGLILGGAVGNFLDRLAFGYVTDFFDLDTPIEWVRSFPVFNVADSALSVGVVLMVLAMVWKRDHKPKTEVQGLA